MLIYILIAAGGYLAGTVFFKPSAKLVAWVKSWFQTKVAGL